MKIHFSRYILIATLLFSNYTFGQTASRINEDLKPIPTPAIAKRIFDAWYNQYQIETLRGSGIGLK